MAIMTTRATNKKTGKSVMIRSADLFRIENCMIAEHWDVVDASGME
jgi:predicted SnoaL-like aldol condensation-catalyzing enzyme